jgi:hypothetical protein
VAGVLTLSHVRLVLDEEHPPSLQLVTPYSLVSVGLPSKQASL